MVIRSVARRCRPSNRHTRVIGCCFGLTLGLWLNQGMAQSVTPVASAGTTDTQRIYAAANDTLVIKPDGSLWGWGRNSSGQLGDGTWIERLTPIQILTGATALAVGAGHILAIKTDGSLWAWGGNWYGQLGDGNMATTQLSPIEVMTGVATIAAGDHHSLAIKTDGTLWAWGANGSGQLGDGTTTDRPRPVQVLSEVAAVAAGHEHSLARKTDGSLWAWGQNAAGQLGDGTKTNRSKPQRIPGFGPTKPDFVVTGMVLTPASPIPDRTFDAAITVMNQGAADGAPGTLQVWADQSAVQDCAAVGDQSATLTPLAQGASETVTVTGLPAGPIGSKTLRAFVDSACQSAETDDANNQSTQAYTVPAPDFVVTSIVLTPAAPAPNGTFEAAVTVFNQGTAAGEPGTLGVWADQPEVPDCAAAPDQSATLPSLAAGASHTVKLSGLPAGTTGSKTLRAFVDSACQSVETDETNNQSTLAYAVSAPDFVVTGIVLTPSGPLANGTFNAAITVKNQGTEAGVPGTLQVWSDRSAAADCAAVGDKSAPLTSLAAGASRTVMLSNLPAGVTGTKTLRAFVDSACLAAESDDTNNQSIKTYAVFPRQIPDFVVTDISLRPGNPIANRTFSAVVTVKNQGSGSGDGGYLEVWADQPTQPTCPANGDVNISVGTLAAGATKTMTVSGLRAATAGTKTLRGFVDSYCRTAESVEDNNQALKEYTVGP
ncbi:CARDB domain-containing protein [uncultured Thiodictyon sp.]|uniref:RCC1 domain-containing protein n=1 Tax=uncultured Thiodictyon sp. TaxID=1846217 RepID=UPI0025EB1672|nr:CARDB domain-containing protein [uncultured Thiodictyon sp.]